MTACACPLDPGLLALLREPDSGHLLVAGSHGQMLVSIGSGNSYRVNGEAVELAEPLTRDAAPTGSVSAGAFSETAT